MLLAVLIAIYMLFKAISNNQKQIYPVLFLLQTSFAVQPQIKYETAFVKISSLLQRAAPFINWPLRAPTRETLFSFLCCFLSISFP